MRYVAEENILLERNSEAVAGLCALKEIGKFFKRYDSEAGKFLMTPDLASRYVDD